MSKWLDRQSLMIGEKNTDKLKKAKVMIVGLGGVGGAAMEALARAGIGNFILVDNDVFDKTNLNRQILSNINNINRKKVEEAKKRILEINLDANIIIKEMFYLPENKNEIFLDETIIKNLDYIIDAIDTVTAKLDIIEMAKINNIPVISSMGMGNRLNPECIKIGDIEDTRGSGCGLSRIMRSELRKRNLTDVKVVYSTEKPRKAVIKDEDKGRYSPGSISFLPPISGYFLAAHVIKSIINID